MGSGIIKLGNVKESRVTINLFGSPYLSLGTLFFLCFLLNPLSAVLPAIEMELDDVILLKTISERAYEDTQYDRNSDVIIHSTDETIGKIRWVKRPFYTEGQKPSSLGSVYYNKDLNALIVGFHGSYWLSDWIEDFKFFQKDASSLSSSLSGKVHQGFSQLIKSCYQNMMDTIQDSLGRDICDDDTIYFTGHSLGGALLAFRLD